MIDLSDYTPEHRLELKRLLDSPEWQETIRSGLIEEVKDGRIEPGKTRNFIDIVVNQLLAFNEERVKGLIEKGYRGRYYLFSELSRWSDDLQPKLSFLGLNVTADCNFKPRCVYCNQPSVDSSVGIEGWKRIIEEATDSNGEGPYIYITGGEPLTLGEDVWGDNGLVRFATERGAVVNVNTNAVMLTPEVALRFIKVGLGKLHISLDTANRDLQNYLRGGHFDGILEGIYNVQLARDIVGVSYPLIHTNCVLTNRNLGSFPKLFEFILKKKKQVDREDPLFNDLFPHVIPVGGNDELRPSEDEFRRFYGEVWSEVIQMWDYYQAKLGIEGALLAYFSNPFLRVEHKGGLDAYVQASAEGRYGRLALSRYCYVAPTQATFTPDGHQYRCGSHAIRRILPVGNIGEKGVFDSIRAGISCVDLPQEEHCYGCALATLYINQTVETKLKERLEAMISV